MAVQNRSGIILREGYATFDTTRVLKVEIQPVLSSNPTNGERSPSTLAMRFVGQ